jgi:HJR/Mrr/RecB family endonuclease
MQLKLCILYCGGRGMDTFFELLITFGRFLVGLWPLMFLAVLAGVIKRKKGFGAMLRTTIKALMASWGFFALLHMVFYFFKMDTFRLLPEDINMKVFLCVGLILMPFELAVMLEERHKKVKAETLEEMKALSASQFEELVAETYRAQGHKVEVIGAPGDHGIDLVVHTRRGETWLVQCKKYRGRVGEPVIRDFYGVLRASNADAGAVVTTGIITSAARLWAEGKPIFLYDGDEFLKVVQAANIRKSIRIRPQRKSVAAAPADLDVDEETESIKEGSKFEEGTPFLGTAFAAANAGLATSFMPEMVSSPQSKFETTNASIFTPPAPKREAVAVSEFTMPARKNETIPESVFAMPAPKVETVPEPAFVMPELKYKTEPEPAYAAPVTKAPQPHTDPYPVQDKRPFMNMVFEAPVPAATKESEVAVDVEDEPLSEAVATATVESTADFDKRPFMTLDDAPVCPACGIPMLLKTENRLFFKPKQQYICQNAPSCDETIDVD